MTRLALTRRSCCCACADLTWMQCIGHLKFKQAPTKAVHHVEFTTPIKMIWSKMPQSVTVLSAPPPEWLSKTIMGCPPNSIEMFFSLEWQSHSSRVESQFCQMAQRDQGNSRSIHVKRYDRAYKKVRTFLAETVAVPLSKYWFAQEILFPSCHNQDSLECSLDLEQTIVSKSPTQECAMTNATNLRLMGFLI